MSWFTKTTSAVRLLRNNWSCKDPEMSGKTTGQRWGFLALFSSTPLSVARAGYAIGILSAYLVFALGCLAIAACAPWANAMSKRHDQRVEWMRRRARGLARLYLGYCRGIGMVNVEYRGARKLPPGLVVANHPSLIDAVWLIATQPHVCCVLKGDLERMWLFRYLASQLDYVSNRDPERLLEDGCKRLLSGETVLVFPEATRTAPGKLPEFRLGAAELAVRSAVPIHPIVFHKTDSYLSKARPWYRFPSEPMHWRIVFAETIPAVRTDDPRHARRQLTADLQCFFHRELSS